MIYFEGKKPVVAISKQLTAFARRSFLEIRKGSRLIWTGIRSCFGGGFWDNGRAWVNDDGWKNE